MVDEFKGEYWNKSQVSKGKELAKSQGYNKFKVKKGSYLGSYTLVGNKGWVGESTRHSMASYGIKTGKVKNHDWYGNIPVIYDDRRKILEVPREVELKANNLSKKFYPSKKKIDLENENVTVEGSAYL